MADEGMSPGNADPRSALHRLTDSFVAPNEVVGEMVDATALPKWAAELLVHSEHMTTRLGSRYGGPIRLSIIDERRTDEAYSRVVGLMSAQSDRVVEVGICRVQLGLVSDAVRAQIIAGQTPLGDILIRHDVMRTIVPRWYWRFGKGSALTRPFDAAGTEAYGRVGVIYYGSAPAIEVLEIVSDR